MTSAQLFLGIALLCSGEASAGSHTWTPDSVGRTQIELYLDPYYSALNYTFPLTSDSIARLDADGERNLYGVLFETLPFPRDFLIEASVNPLPLGGVVMRREAYGAYNQASFGEVNLVQALTQGFPEPWAVSLFFGNVVNLVSSQDSGKIHGIGYSGFLATYGNEHILANRMVDDHWLELEVKLKGDDLRKTRKLGWSFRAGVKEHSNEDIRSVWYLAVRRSRTDFQESGFSLLRNGYLEFRMDLDQNDLPRPTVLKYSLVVGKKIPFASGKAAFTLDLGLIRQENSGYRGDLADFEPAQWMLVLRPNVEF